MNSVLSSALIALRSYSRRIHAKSLPIVLTPILIFNLLPINLQAPSSDEPEQVVGIESAPEGPDQGILLELPEVVIDEASYEADFGQVPDALKAAVPSAVPSVGALESPLGLGALDLPPSADEALIDSPGLPLAATEGPNDENVEDPADSEESELGIDGLSTEALDADTYRVTYLANGGVSLIEDTNEYEASETVLVIFTPTPTRSGLDSASFVFLGWANDPEATEATYTVGGDDSFVIEADVVLYAVWEEGAYEPISPMALVDPPFEVWFRSGIGSDDADIQILVDSDDVLLGDLALPADPSAKTGWEFVRWSPDLDLLRIIDSDLEFVAQWQAIPDLDLLAVDHLVFVYGDLYLDITKTETGNNLWFHIEVIFAGTNYGVQDFHVEDPGSHETHVTIETADFRLSFTINLHGNRIDDASLEDLRSKFIVQFLPGEHGTFPPAFYAGLELNAVTPAAPVPTGEVGWTFNGWTDGTMFYAESALPLTVTGNVTYTATWVPTMYFVTVNGSNALDSGEGLYLMDDLVYLDAGSQTGFAFDGWVVNEGGAVLDDSTSPNTSFVMPAANVEVTATWSAIFYQVTVIDSYDDNPGDGSYNFGDPVIIRAGTRPGFTFIDWTVNSGGAQLVQDDNPLTAFTMPASGVVITANWETGYYKVTVIDSFAAVTGAGTYAMDDHVTIYAGTRIGWEFVQWIEEVDSTVDSSISPIAAILIDPYSATTSFDMPPEDMKFTAVWRQLEYQVTYDANGGIGAPTDNTIYHYQDTVTVKNDIPTKSGYSFEGWLSDADQLVYSGEDHFMMPPDNVVLTAVWEAIDYTVTVNNSYADVTGAGTYIVDDDVSIDAGFREGYSFVGWTVDTSNASILNVSDNATSFSMPAADVVVTANWRAINYTVVVNDSYAVNSGAGTYNINNQVTINAGLREGYTFTGWTVDSANVTLSDSALDTASFTMPAADVEVTATWSANDYSVIVYDSYAAVSGAGTYNIGNTVDLDAGTRPGYDFTGWTNDSANITFVDDTSAQTSFIMPAANVVVTANWVAIDYTVTVNNSFAAVTGAGTYNIGNTVTINAGTRTGYTFDGWTVDTANATLSNDTLDSTTFEMPAANVEVTANWTIIDYTVTVNNSYAAVSGAGTYNYLDKVELDAGSRIGFTFTGWTVNSTNVTLTDSSVAATDFTMPDANVVVTANWLANDYTVTVIDSFATTSGAGTYLYADDVDIDAGTREGYTFTGWVVDSGNATLADDTQNATSFSMPDANVVVRATWSANDYTVTVNNSYAVVSGAGTYQINNTVTINAGNRLGYIFTGWTVDTANADLVDATLSTTTFAMPADDVTVTANWQAIYYSVTVNNSFASPTGAGDYIVDDIVTINAGTREGYTFVGWTVSTLNADLASTLAATTTFTMPASNVVVSANWRANDYSVTVHNSFAALSGAGTYNINNLVTINAGSRLGYTFTGWTVDTGNATLLNQYETITTFTMSAANVEVTANWSANQYTVTVVNSYASNPGSGIYEMDEGVLIQAGARLGYEFVGWTVNSGGAVLVNALDATTAFSMPAANVVVTANWDAIGYEVTVIDSYAAVTGAGIYHINETVTIRAGQLPGYRFSYWSVKSGGEIYEEASVVLDDIYAPTTFFTMPAEDVEATANWEHVPYTVEYDPNNGAPRTGQSTQFYNDEVFIISFVPTRTGYSFTGWLYNGTLYHYGDKITMPEADVLFVGQWQAATLTVYFDSQGGTAPTPASKTVTFNSPYGPLATTTRAGYNFTGWYTAPTGGTLVTANTIVTTAVDHTLYARWSLIVVPPTTYTVTYAPGDHGTFAPQTTGGLIYGAATPAAPNPTGEEGWVFSAWSPAVQATVTGSITYTAQWTAAPEPEEESFTVTFIDWDNTVLKVQVVPRGGDATAPPDPSRDGYTFTGWDRDFTNVQSDLTVRAVYEAVVEPEPVPLAAFWALINLILCLIGALLAIVTFIRAILPKKKDEDEDTGETEQTKNRMIFVILTVVLGVLGVIIFILTEDMRNPMILVDRWTIVNLIVLLVEAIVMYFAFRRASEEEDRDSRART